MGGRATVTLLRVTLASPRASDRPTSLPVSSCTTATSLGLEASETSRSTEAGARASASDWTMSGTAPPLECVARHPDPAAPAQRDRSAEPWRSREGPLNVLQVREGAGPGGGHHDMRREERTGRHGGGVDGAADARGEINAVHTQSTTHGTRHSTAHGARTAHAHITGHGTRKAHTPHTHCTCTAHALRTHRTHHTHCTHTRTRRFAQAHLTREGR